MRRVALTANGLEVNRERERERVRERERERERESALIAAARF